MHASVTSPADRSREVARLLRGEPGHVHLLGVCGVGMAGLALLLQDRGFRVTGCDLLPNRLAGRLERAGISVRTGHDAAHITDDTAWVVRSAAVPPTAPELEQARERGLPVFARGEVLPALLEGRCSVAVSGTHGKTTTTAFIAQILRHAGRAPSWCVGGELGELGVAETGRGDLLVVEADESDGTVALYRPDVAVVTNVDFDHMEHFAGVEQFEACFRALVHGTRRRVVFCADDPRAAAICGAREHTLSYGLSARAAVAATDIQGSAFRQSFTVARDGAVLGPVTLSAGGSHNVLNALAAIAVALELGLPFGEIRAGLGAARLPRRRFELVAEQDGIRVVSDYAHHPAEVSALFRTAGQLPHARLLAVFQPHRYTRTAALGHAFPAAFRGAARVILAPVYAASETPCRGGTSWDLYARWRAEQPETDVVLADSPAQAWAALRRGLRRDDVLLVVGAGDVAQVADWAAAALTGHTSASAPDAGPPPDLTPGLCDELCAGLGRGAVAERDAVLAPRTTWGVGGAADLLVTPASAAGLARLLAGCARHGQPVQVLGAGSNVLVGDLGVRGVVVRLTGGEFESIRREDDGVVAAAGVSLQRLLGWLTSRGLSGLEFLEGIPGTLGGALRMNAGAHGGTLLEHVLWIRCLNRDGTECTVASPDLGEGYRDCRALHSRIALEAALKVSPGDEERIRQRCAEIGRTRLRWQGVRCAGSVFRNPPGEAAGRLVERAGLKGRVIGGASVWREHANVIVTAPGARASDVRALIETVRLCVADRFGVALQPEVAYLG